MEGEQDKGKDQGKVTQQNKRTLKATVKIQEREKKVLHDSSDEEEDQIISTKIKHTTTTILSKRKRNAVSQERSASEVKRSEDVDVGDIQKVKRSESNDPKEKI